ncbi:MAG: hypothetical protein J6M01_05380, partial [Prevotella sp.]|nr:hypothetical protein [Prevotella sp.]
MMGFVFAAAYQPTNATETIELTKASIQAEDFLSVTTDNWKNGSTYGGVTGDFYNMSKDDRQLKINVKGVSKFEVFVQNSNAGRKYTVKVGSGDPKTVTHNGGGVESSGEIETGTTDEVTITLAGFSSESASVYPVKIVLTKGEGAGGTTPEPTGDVTANWDWEKGVPATLADVHIEGTTGKVASDVKGIEMTVDATGKDGTKGKLKTNGTNVQFNQYTKLQIPVKSKGDEVTVVAHSYNYDGIIIGGTMMVDTDVLTHTHTATDADVTAGYVEIEAPSNMYLVSVKVVQKATAASSEPVDIEIAAADITDGDITAAIAAKTEGVAKVGNLTINLDKTVAYKVT